MKTTVIASALLALSVAASGNAFAQRGDHGNDQRQYQKHDDRRDNHHDARWEDKRYDRKDYARHDARTYHRDDRRGAGPRHDLRRGGYLSREYRSNRYVVSDWRNRHLSAPPRGHQWVRTGNDYVLAAIATGLIAQVLFSN